MNISSIVKTFILIQNVLRVCVYLRLWQSGDTKLMGKLTYTKEIQNID